MYLASSAQLHKTNVNYIVIINKKTTKMLHVSFKVQIGKKKSVLESSVYSLSCNKVKHYLI